MTCGPASDTVPAFCESHHRVFTSFLAACVWPLATPLAELAGRRAARRGRAGGLPSVAASFAARLEPFLHSLLRRSWPSVAPDAGERRPISPVGAAQGYVAAAGGR